jgi:hypothetical protein
MAGQVKKDREWATRTDAIKHLAERPNMSAAEAFGLLFNSEPATLTTAAKSLQSGIAARKRQEMDRLRAELEAHDKANAAVQAEAKAAEVDARLAAQATTQGKAKTA